MFNCASFETDFGSFGSFKKIVFFHFRFRFCLGWIWSWIYSWTYARSDSWLLLSLLPWRNTTLVWREFERNNIYTGATHTRSLLVANYYLTKGGFLPLLISTTQQGRTLTTLRWCFKSCSKSKPAFFNKDKKTKFWDNLNYFNFNFSLQFRMKISLQFELYNVADRSTFHLI